MHWTLADLYALPLEVYDVLTDELVKEADALAKASKTRTSYR
jgi:hypothetical protein